jgi:hypothetical protein
MRDRTEDLEQVRRETNEALAYGRTEKPHKPSSIRGDFGPPHGFASLGSYYGQNAPGFWDRRK